MKITLCAHSYVPPFLGGVDVYTDRLGRAFLRGGHAVNVIGLNDIGKLGSDDITITDDEHSGIRIRRINFSFERRPKEAFHLAYDEEIGARIKELLNEDRPDLFIIMNFYKITLASVVAAKELNIPVVHIATDFIPVCRRGTFTRWDNRPCQVGESIKSCSACFISHRFPGRMAAALLGEFSEETLMRWASIGINRNLPHPIAVLKPYWKQVSIMRRRLDILRSLRTEIDLVVVPTEFTYDIFLKNGFAASQLYYLPFGVEKENSLTEIKHTPSRHTRFLFIGRLQPYKGAHLLVDAFSRLLEPRGATLTLYGEPDVHDRYFEGLKEAMVIHERINFAGRIASDHLGEAFAETDFFVLPSLWHENSPLILLDALQSKTPVIASKIGGVTDLIKDGVNGLLFPMGDREALQNALQRVIDQPELKDKFISQMSLSDIDGYADFIVSHLSDSLI